MVVDRPGVTEAILRERIHGWLDRTGTVDLVVQAAEAGEYEVDGQLVGDPVAAVAELVDDPAGGAVDALDEGDQLKGWLGQALAVRFASARGR